MQADGRTCECGNDFFAPVYRASDLIGTIANLGALVGGAPPVRALQCCACGVIHTQMRATNGDATYAWSRLEFNGAEGRWLEAPQ